MDVVNGEGTTRRERQRAQTRAEILAAGRALVARGEELSLRAVARAVGMTAPALYRYVDGQKDLMDAIGGALYDELIDELEQARDAVDPSDLPERLTVMAYAFRGWALAHRHEYAQLFANPLASEVDDDESGCTHEGAERFAGVFAEVFAAMWEAGMITAPDLDQVDPALLRMLEPGVSGQVELPVAVRYLFVRQWSRLYGMVTLEAFGHLHRSLRDSLPLFEAALADCAAELGWPEQETQRSSSLPNLRDATAKPTDPMTSR